MFAAGLNPYIVIVHEYPPWHTFVLDHRAGAHRPPEMPTMVECSREHSTCANALACRGQ
jgi:hypothetical protein